MTLSDSAHQEPAAKPIVFISYCSANAEDRDRLVKHLAALRDRIELCSDVYIEAGADWRQEIGEAIEKAQVAILLITADFLASEFIRDRELPALLREQQRRGLKVFPVIARPCSWKSVGWLEGIEVRPKDGPVWGSSGNPDEKLAAIVREIDTYVGQLAEPETEPETGSWHHPMAGPINPNPLRLPFPKPVISRPAWIMWAAAVLIVILLAVGVALLGPRLWGRARPTSPTATIPLTSTATSTHTPTATPTHTPSPTPLPACNLHIDDFGDEDPANDLRQPSTWELVPSECGTLVVSNTPEETLRFELAPRSSACTARYTTGLSLNASTYSMLSLALLEAGQPELSDIAVTLSDARGGKKAFQIADWAYPGPEWQWRGVDIPLQAFATALDISQLMTLTLEITAEVASGPRTVELDRLRLEQPLVPLVVDNFDDQQFPNALGGASRTYVGNGSSIEIAYAVEGTHAGSPGSLEIGYTLPDAAKQWAIWETDLLGLDVSDYAALTFYIRGAQGGEQVNVYLQDADKNTYVDLETYGSVTQAWTAVQIPLEAFPGVSLTDLKQIKFVLEWETVSGTIWIDGLRFVADSLRVDSFCDTDASNSLNGNTATFTEKTTCSKDLLSTLDGAAQRLEYDVRSSPSCYAGYWSHTFFDLTPYRTLALKVRGEPAGQTALADAEALYVSNDKLKLGDFLPTGITDQWQVVRIPLAAFTEIRDWARGNAYVIVFESERGATRGSIWFDDVAFELAPAPLWVDHFADQDDWNALNGKSGSFGHPAAQVSHQVSTQYGDRDADAGLMLRYTVPVGSYAGWETDLRGVDLSGYAGLVFRMRGEHGDETPNVYLNSLTGQRAYVDLETYQALSTEWQEYVIPLEDFDDLNGAQVRSLQVIIEWVDAETSGALYLDDIHFSTSDSAAFQ